MASGIEVRSIDHGDELGNNDYGLWMREQRKQDDTSERDGVDGLDIFRSGSAPPTVEGSLNAVGGLFTHHGDVWSPAINKRDISEEILRSDPAYVNYYYSHVNMNPRLPPPLLSKEDWRFTQQRCSGGSMLGGIGDRRTGSKGSGNEGVNNMSLFSAQLGFSEEKEEDGAELRNGQCEWGGDGLIGLPGLGLGSGQKIIAEILQDDSSQAANISRHPSRPASRNTFDEVTSESQYPQLEHDLSSDVLSSTTGHIEGSASKSAGYSSLSYGSALGSSLSRSATPDPQHIARVSSPLVPPVGEGRINSMDKRTMTGPTLLNGFNSSESADLVAALAGMNLAGDHLIDEEKHFRSHLPHDISKQQTMFHDSFRQQSDPRYLKHDLYFNSADSGSLHQQCVSQSAKGSFHNMSRTNGYGMDRKPYYLRTDAQVDHLKLNGSNSPNYRSVGSPSSAIPNYSLSGHTINPALASMMASQLGNSSIPLFYDNATGSPVGGGGMGVDARALGGGLHENVGRARNQPVIDPMLRHYLRSSEFAAAHLNESSLDMNLLALQKAYLGNVFSPQKTERGGPHLGKSGGFSPGYCGNQALGLGMAYGGNRLVNSHLNSSVGFGSHMRQGDRRYVSGMRNLAAGGMGGWRSDMGSIMEQSFGSSLLDEFKSNKTKCLELSEISGHVFEFSADQYGSRFIQQKLETASIEEKNMVFHEIISQALPLMTDVFGNYVIQKFFEHGTAAQIRDLANELTGHVLTLSLQMYGCRVIQKAIEVVDLDQQKKMVTELDGHVMRCVRDQNGNHVIQKCIECIPEDAVHFIVSTFFDHVVHLSTHPYGCRVIQRVLEHCHDPKTQETVMDEIMQSVCMLAQDQYGNYVVQHVLEHGKPDERSAIISKLTGKIVQMSQQKFASNVIEKCLTFGDADERRAIVNEMLGATEDNEPLQVMMKDQFGNYVVQKVLETCDAEQLELLLMRIKIHLNALKKYTYGKHIVARVEKLVAAGERRIGMQASYTAT